MYKKGKYILYKEHMNFRSEPRANSRVLGVIPQGKCIEVTEISDNWGKCVYNGETGWCCISECFAEFVCTCGKKCELSVQYEMLKQASEELLKIADRIKKITENSVKQTCSSRVNLDD